LKWWRVNQGRTIENVAAALGVSTSAWGHWETGHPFPSGGMLLDLSSLTGLPPHILLCPGFERCPFIRKDGPSCAATPDCPCCEPSLALMAAEFGNLHPC
jgi:transcriptional regulator with XRE-family HTH domain